MALRLELKHMRGRDGKVRYYWVLYEGRRYLAYIGKEPTLSYSEAEEIAKQKKISLEALLQVPSLTIKSEVGAELNIGDSKIFSEILKRIRKRGEPDFEHFCNYFNDATSWIESGGFNQQKQRAIIREIQSIAKVIKSVILALDHWWVLRRAKGLESWQEYEAYREGIIQSIRPPGLDPKNVTWEAFQLPELLKKTEDPIYQAFYELDYKVPYELKDALAELNVQPGILFKFEVSLREGGVVTYEVGRHIPEGNAGKRFGDELIARDLCYAVEDFKQWLGRYQSRGRFPIGVCHFKDCERLFVKKRRDQLYCLPQHKVQAFRKSKNNVKSSRD